MAVFGWWTASDVQKELAFQDWLKISAKYLRPDEKPRFCGDNGRFWVCDCLRCFYKEIAFQDWLKISAKYFKPD